MYFGPIAIKETFSRRLKVENKKKNLYSVVRGDLK